MRAIEKYLKSEGEFILSTDFEYLAAQGESRIIERKSIRDFKDFDRNANKIKNYLSKAASAFSNHGGGIMLIGVDDKGNIEEGVNVESRKQSMRERLIDLIESNITPPLTDFAVKKVERSGKYLFIVVVGDSRTAPHQANDRRYYGRIDGKSLPLDGIQVRDISTRVREVLLEPFVEVKDHNPPPVTALKLGVRNLSKTCADDVLIFGEFISNGSIRGDVDSLGGSTSSIPGGGKYFQYKIDILYPGVPHAWRELPRDIGIWGVPTYVKLNISTVARNSKRTEHEFVLERSGPSFLRRGS